MKEFERMQKLAFGDIIPALKHIDNKPISLTENALKTKIKELIHSSLGEAKKKKKKEDVAPQEDVNLEMNATEEMPEDTMAPESTDGVDINPTVKSIQDSLQRAFAQAKQLGDAKLATQIGNTLTMLLRDQVIGVQQDVNEIEDQSEEDLSEKDTQKLVKMFIDIQFAIEAPFEMSMDFETTDEEYDKLMAAWKVARQLEIKYGGKKYGIGAIMPDNK
jgi:hypothetical protein